MNKLWNHTIYLLSLLLVLSLLSLGLTRAPELRPVEASVDYDMEAPVELPIVMYHHILKESARQNKYTISPDEFRMDLQFLKENGYTSVTVADLIAFVDGEGVLPKKPVMITFDDGYESFHEYAFPLLQEYGFQAVFSVVGRYADVYSQTEDHHIRYSHCNWEQLAQMQESGVVEIQNHSYNLHVNENGRHGADKKAGESADAYREILLNDLGRMQVQCYDYLGATPTAFTYPFGQINDEALPVLQELGFRAALICQEKINVLTGDPEELYRLNRFNRPHGKSLQLILAQAQRATN